MGFADFVIFPLELLVDRFTVCYHFSLEGEVEIANSNYRFITQ